MSFYPTTYYSFVDRSRADYANSLHGKVKTLLLGPENHTTRDPAFPEPGRILDVGCGSGWFIAKMKDEGWKVTGVEPSASAAEIGRSQGLNILTGSLLAAAFPDNSFDYIRFNHSFEHVPNPNEVLEEVRRILAPQGKLLIGVPNRASFNARIFGPYWWHLALPVHTFVYTPRTLSRMLSTHRFHVEKIVFNTERGALCGSIQLYLNRKDAVLTCDGRFAASRLARMLCHWIARAQNRLKVGDVIEMTAIKTETH